MKKVFLNTKTGEIVYRKTKWGAMRYFKADGKVAGYSVEKKDIVRVNLAQKIEEAFAEVLAEAFEDWVNEQETTDGIA